MKTSTKFLSVIGAIIAIGAYGAHQTTGASSAAPESTTPAVTTEAPAPAAEVPAEAPAEAPAPAGPEWQTPPDGAINPVRVDVVEVIDAATVVVNPGTGPMTISLIGIDATETNECEPLFAESAAKYHYQNPNGKGQLAAMLFYQYKPGEAEKDEHVGVRTIYMSEMTNAPTDGRIWRYLDIRNPADKRYYKATTVDTAQVLINSNQVREWAFGPHNRPYVFRDPVYSWGDKAYLSGCEPAPDPDKVYVSPGGGGGGGDDDFNVPGWLCPTRFC